MHALKKCIVFANVISGKMVDVEEKQIKNSEGNLKFIHATKMTISTLLDIAYLLTHCTQSTILKFLTKKEDLERNFHCIW